MASDEKIRRLIEKTEELTRQIKNMKAKIRRRRKKMDEIFEPLEKQRTEIEIELLKKKLLGLQLEELKFNLPLIEAIIKYEYGEKKPAIIGIDWSKAGRA